MVKHATTRPMAANTSRKVLKNPRADAMASWFSSAICAPVTASVPSGMTRAIRAVSSSAETPGSASTSTVSTSSAPPSITSWVVARSQSATLAPPGESTVPNLAVPTSGNSWGPVWVSTVTLVADGQVALRGGAGVEHQLARTGPLAPRREAPRVQRVVAAEAHAHGGGAPGRVADRLAVGPDRLGEAHHVALGVGDAPHGGHRVEHVAGHATPSLGGGGALHAALGSHHGVGLGVDAGEQVVERGRDGVGEDQRAGQERHPQ